MVKNDIRTKIHSLIKKYYKSVHAKKTFIPGKSKIPYAGRVFDSKEMIALTDSALEFWLTAGHFSKELEKRLKQLTGARSFLLVNSGSSANLLMIASLVSDKTGKGLKPGQEIITPAVTFPTTVSPVIQYGLVPVFVDAELGTYNINADLVEKAVSKKTKAILVPHTLGNPCDMDKLKLIAKKKKLILLEDSCDALGSTYRGRTVGSFGDLASFSFYPAHHMTMGEGGGLAVNRSDLVQKAGSLRDWGRDCNCPTGISDSCGRRFSMKKGDLPYGYDHKYVYSNIGYNLKVTEMQSAVGLTQLDKLPVFIKSRQENFSKYYRVLSQYRDHLILPEWHKYSVPSWFGFPITVKNGVKRLDLIKWLESARIETRLMFGGNIVRQPAYRNVKYRISGKLKNSDDIMRNTFFIGVYPGLTDEMIDYVSRKFKEFFRHKKNFR